jgi:iron(III) transport system substrate-binding protein
VKDSAPIAEAFEKKYGIKVSLWRASGEKVVQRALTEARAGRFTPDVIETDGIEMEILAREKLLTEFFSPAFNDIPPTAFPPHRQYVADRFNFFVIAYNTNLVKPNDIPAAYQDLLQPRWAGKIGIEAGDTDWFGALVKSMGEKEGLAYFRKLAESRPQIRTGHTLMSELVAAGEIPIAAAVYNHAVERLATNGAPIRWKALAPTFGRAGAVAVARNAPHPHAALLFADFILSRQGQELIKQRNRVPSSAAVDSPLNKFPYQMIDPAIVLDESDKWEKLWADLFLKGQKLNKAAD